MVRGQGKPGPGLLGACAATPGGSWWESTEVFPEQRLKAINTQIHGAEASTGLLLASRCQHHGPASVSLHDGGEVSYPRLHTPRHPQDQTQKDHHVTMGHLMHEALQGSPFQHPLVEANVSGCSQDGPEQWMGHMPMGLCHRCLTQSSHISIYGREQKPDSAGQGQAPGGTGVPRSLLTDYSAKPEGGHPNLGSPR